MTIMLQKAGECAKMLDLKFNGAKSQYIVLDAAPSSVPVPPIPFCGVDVPRVSARLHLGNIIMGLILVLRPLRGLSQI